MAVLTRKRRRMMAEAVAAVIAILSEDLMIKILVRVRVSNPFAIEVRVQAVEITGAGSPIHEEEFSHIILGHQGSHIQSHGGHERVSIATQYAPALAEEEKKKCIRW